MVGGRVKEPVHHVHVGPVVHQPMGHVRVVDAEHVDEQGLAARVAGIQGEAVRQNDLQCRAIFDVVCAKR